MYIITWDSGITQPEDKGILLKDIIENDSVDRDKSFCIDANYGKGGNEKRYTQRHSRQLVITGGAIRGRNMENPSDRTPGIDTEQRLEINQTGKSNALTSVSKDSLVVNADNITWRKLTPIECERLQTVPDNYTNHVSNSQRYKMLGNGWTVDVIAHIFYFLKESIK